MPRRELKNGKQVADWLAEVGGQLKTPGDLLAPKLKRNEVRDRAHAEWVKRIRLPG